MLKIEEMIGKIYNADCLEIMKQMPDKCVDLVLTDPPYFRVKNDDWDRQWKNEKAFIDWIELVVLQFKRILKPNGSLYLFASPDMCCKIEMLIRKHFNVLNNIRWRKEIGQHLRMEKESLRSYQSAWESIIFAEQYGDAYDDASKALHKNVYAPIGRYIQTERESAGFTRNDVEVGLGYISGSDPNRGTALCYRWEEGSSLPTKETYERLRVFINSKGGNYLRREYEDLRREYEDLRREYEDLRRPFFGAYGKNCEDILTFDPVAAYDGKHPCEKPQALLQHLIAMSSKKTNIVLDAFAGGGSCGQASITLGREFIGIEKEPKYCAIAQERVDAERAQLKLF